MHHPDRLLASDDGQVVCHYVVDKPALWSWLHQPNRVPCINHALLQQLYQHHDEIARSGGQVNYLSQALSVRYSVFASSTPSYFHLGGDLQHMAAAIRRRDKAALEAYVRLSIEVVA